MRQRVRSWRAKSGCSRHRLYIAGTISACVMRSRAASGRNSAALNAGMITSLPALQMKVVISATSPVTCDSGTAATVQSPGPSAMPMRKCIDECTRPRCVSIAPFGWPVVPDV